MEPLELDDPATVGPYRLIARLGAGGMGRVYLARSAGGRTVAVKVVRADLTEESGFRARFRAEAEAAQAVDGAYTAPVLEADPDAELPWLATEYILGPSLTDAIAAHGPLPGPTVHALGAGLADALAAIHAAGLVHRDLKPSNILLSTSGPRVIDFGIARVLEGTRLTSTGLVVGSPGFMSPEQASDLPVGTPSDVFSLGSVLVYAATGNGPFGSGMPHAMLYRVVHDEPDLSGLPEDLVGVVRSCLAKNPAARPQPHELSRYFAPGGSAAALADGWLPSRVASAIASHAVRVMNLDTPATGSAPVPPPAAPTGPYDPRTMQLGAQGPTAPAQPYPQQYPQLPAQLYAQPPTQQYAQPSAQPSTQPIAQPPARQGAPSRRTLLAGLVGVAVAGGTGFGVWELTRSGQPKTRSDSSDNSTASPSPAWPSRPPGTAPTPLWTYHGQQLPPMPVLAAGGRVLVPGSTLTALDPKNGGKVAWTMGGQRPGVEYPLVAVQGSTVATVVRGGDSTSSLVAYNTSDGQEQWRTKGVPGSDLQGVLGGDDTSVYLQATGGAIAVDRTSHKSTWGKNWDGFDGTLGQLLVAGSTLLRGSRADAGNSLVAHDARTGDIRWTYPVGKEDTLITHEFAADDKNVYLAGLELVALDLNTGKPVFNVPNPDAATDIFGPPAVKDGVVFVAQDLTKTKAAYAFSAKDGKQLWRTTLPAAAADHRSPLVIGSVVFFPAYQDEAGFFALDCKTGNLLWTFQDAARPGRTWQLSTDGTLLYAVHGDTVYALPPV